MTIVHELEKKITEYGDTLWAELANGDEAKDLTQRGKFITYGQVQVK